MPTKTPRSSKLRTQQKLVLELSPGQKLPSSTAMQLSVGDTRETHSAGAHQDRRKAELFQLPAKDSKAGFLHPSLRDMTDKRAGGFRLNPLTPRSAPHQV